MNKDMLTVPAAVSAVTAAVEQGTDNMPPLGETKIIGQAVPRIDAYERVSGSAVYAMDVMLPGMLHAAVLRCPHAHAMVKKADTRAAEAMPGVHAILTAFSPEAKLTMAPPYWVEDAPPMPLFDQHCRYAGEEVAAVAAETPQQAWDAVRRIEVEYQPLPFVLDAEDALKPGAVAVQEKGNLVRPAANYERGSVQKGFADSDAVVERTYSTACQVHATMETHGSVAQWDGDRLTVWHSTQGAFDEQRALAQTLSLPLSSVRIIAGYMGGGFGSKAELSKHTVLAALLARKTARPVKLFLTREEAFLAVGNRPPCKMTLKAGVKKDGTLTALEMHSTGVVGAYSELADTCFPAAFLYLCPNVRTENKEVHINAGKARAMRAPGFPQGAWALEQMMDELAHRIGMDPVEFRLMNLSYKLQEYGPNRVSVPYTSMGLKECLEEGAKAFGWKEGRARKPEPGKVLRGVGVACGFWGAMAAPPATVVLKLYPDGSANLNMGAADLGTGTKTVMAMIVAEELGIALDKIHIEHADTATTQYAQVSGGSRTVIVNGPAVRAAALDAKRQLLELAAEEMKQSIAELRLEAGKIVPASAPDKAVMMAQLKKFDEQQVIVAVGVRKRDPRGKGRLAFAAHFAEVEVNPRTGEVKVTRVLAAHDSGRVMNRLTFENQVFGGIAMGIGYGVSERRVLDAAHTGRVLTANLHNYKVPTAMDVPYQQTCLPIELHDTEVNPLGAKGIGEPATIPTAPAIANAVFHAAGIRVTDTPISPMQLLALLAETRKSRSGERA